jgi:hypothetical protein
MHATVGDRERLAGRHGRTRVSPGRLQLLRYRNGRPADRGGNTGLTRQLIARVGSPDGHSAYGDMRKA